MRFSTVAFVSALAGSAVAAPYSPFPLSDGFPSPSASQLASIEYLAGGTIPNGALPSKLTATATATLQLIALNEIFEVAFFTDLLANITNGVSGYELTGQDSAFITKAITAIKNQEELHAAGANGILANAGQTTIKPCKYNFPVSSYNSAIALANTFTDVVLGVLPQAQTVFAEDGGDETGLVNLLGSIIAQEAEQNGWYRVQQGKVPSAAPFLTTEGPSFAFTFLQSVIVPGSCPNIDLIQKAIPTFKTLTYVSGAKNYNSTATFSVEGEVSASKYSIVYLSGQNVPLTVPITSVSTQGGNTVFNAEFPFDGGLLARGLTVAALVDCTGKQFASAADVAAKTVYGPGIIELDY